MDRVFIAVVTGILEGLLLCAGIFTRNPFAFTVAVAFFIFQWRWLGKEGINSSLKRRLVSILQQKSE
jgi:hypothetical protein